MSQTHLKQRAALISIAASAGLLALKLFLALITGSLGLLSEALHSLIDLAATVITWFAIRWADQPADDEHQFGHAKVESLAALFEAMLLVGTACFVAYHAALRLIAGHSGVEVSWWVIVILLASIAVDFNRSKALRKTADATASDALAADAAHFESDMWSSGAVLAGLLGVLSGFAWADAVAALFVSAFIVWIAWGLGKKSLATLLDAAPEGVTSTLRQLVEATPGVLAVNQLRIRPAGAELFVELGVDVSRLLPAAAVAELKLLLENEVRKIHPKADTTLLITAVELDGETAFDKIAAIAAAKGLAVHHLTVQEIEGKLAASFDLEVDGSTTLDDAHERATELESAIRSGLGGDVEVESHIEPAPVSLMAGKPADQKTFAAVCRGIKAAAKPEKTITDLHNFRVRQNETGLFLHYHCRFSPEIRVDSMHAVVDRIEARFLLSFPQVKRVVAHAEPVGRPHHPL